MEIGFILINQNYFVFIIEMKHRYLPMEYRLSLKRYHYKYLL